MQVIIHSYLSRAVIVLGIEKIETDRINSHRVLRREQARRPVTVERRGRPSSRSFLHIHRMDSAVQAVNQKQHGFAAQLRMACQVHQVPVNAGLFCKSALMQVVISPLGRPANQRAVMILSCKCNARAGVGLEIGKVNQVFSLSKGFGNIILLDPLRIAAPINRNRGDLHLYPAKFASPIHAPYIRKFPVDDVVILIGKIRQAVADGDVRRLDPGSIHELPHQGNEQLGRGAHIVYSAAQLIGLGIDAAGREDKADEIDLYGNLLARLIADVSLAVSFIEIPEQLVPRLGIGCRPGQCADRLRHHLLNFLRVCMLRLPRMSVPRAFPVSGLRIVCPDNPAGIDPPAYTYRLIGGLRLGYGRILAGSAQSNPKRTDAQCKEHQANEIAPAGEIQPGFSEDCRRCTQTNQPGDKARSHWKCDPLTWIERPRRLGNNANQKPYQRCKPGKW